MLKQKIIANTLKYSEQNFRIQSTFNTRPNIDRIFQIKDFARPAGDRINSAIGSSTTP